MFNYEISNATLYKIGVDLDRSGYIKENGNERFTSSWGKFAVKVPDGVVEIASSIFDSNCSDFVYSIIIPASVKKIDDEAFNIPNITIIIEKANKTLFQKYDKDMVHFLPSRCEMFRLLEHNQELNGLNEILMRCCTLKSTVIKNFLLFENKIITAQICHNNYKISSISIVNSWIRYSSDENHNKLDSYCFLSSCDKLDIEEVRRLFRG